MVPPIPSKSSPRTYSNPKRPLGCPALSRHSASWQDAPSNGTDQSELAYVRMLARRGPQKSYGCDTVLILQTNVTGKVMEITSPVRPHRQS
jgi:hypothetical protein